MTLRGLALLSILSSGAALSVWSDVSSSVAGEPTMVTTGAVVSVTAFANPNDEKQTYSYVGSKNCKKCHLQVYKSWEKTKMGMAFDILKPGQFAEAKKKFNIDVDKDYTTDEKCLKCHTTGYGQAGGYAIPDPNDKKAVRKAKKLRGVGCESCHGPGSAYTKIFKEIMKSKRSYKVDELYAAGLQKIDKSTCLTCHNEESPTIAAGDSFDYEKRKDEGTHEHETLKQREE